MTEQKMKTHVALGLILLLSLFSCKKSYDIIDLTNPIEQSNLPLDSVLWVRNSTAVLPINLDSNPNNEIVLQWINSNGLGGGGSNSMNVIIHDSNWQVLTTTYIDTTCVDTVYINGIRTFHFSNGSNCGNISSIDTITFASMIDSIALQNAFGPFLYKDTILGFSNTNVQPMLPYPDAPYYQTMIGSSKMSTGEYLLFKNKLGLRKAVLYKYFYRDGQPPYYYLMQIITL